MKVNCGRGATVPFGEGGGDNCVGLAEWTVVDIGALLENAQQWRQPLSARIVPTEKDGCVRFPSPPHPFPCSMTTCINQFQSRDQPAISCLEAARSTLGPSPPALPNCPIMFLVDPDQHSASNAIYPRIPDNQFEMSSPLPQVGLPGERGSQSAGLRVNISPPGQPLLSLARLSSSPLTDFRNSVKHLKWLVLQADIIDLGIQDKDKIKVVDSKPESENVPICGALSG
ncbi:hypothetical protein EGW08_012380 [Elysia chlorotica]|uniref:Uncharacterized protein n=1 Tax=Elysia chlorotica TaxID=188477 RepID=A0A3S0ZKI0_ELYCH|nr:hypothetical protein EGW08_012380 [Elysia chlorotica]